MLSSSEGTGATRRTTRTEAIPGPREARRNTGSRTDMLGTREGHGRPCRDVGHAWASRAGHAGLAAQAASRVRTLRTGGAMPGIARTALGHYAPRRGHRVPHRAVPRAPRAQRWGTMRRAAGTACRTGLRRGHRACAGTPRAAPGRAAPGRARPRMRRPPWIRACRDARDGCRNGTEQSRQARRRERDGGEEGKGRGDFTTERPTTASTDDGDGGDAWRGRDERCGEEMRHDLRRGRRMERPHSWSARAWLLGPAASARGGARPVAAWASAQPRRAAGRAASAGGAQGARQCGFRERGAGGCRLGRARGPREQGGGARVWGKGRAGWA
jgi:hypothetical protein